MKSSITFLKNIISVILVRLTVPIGTSVIFILLARMVGVEAVGRYTLLLTLFLVFQSLASLGLGPLLIRQIAQKKKDPEGLYAGALLISSVGVLLWAPIMIAITGFGEYPSDVFISSIVLAFGLPFACVCLINEASFMGLEKFEFIPLINFIEMSYLLSAGLAVLLVNPDLVALSFVLASGKLLSACVGTWLLFKKFSFRRLGIDRELIVRLLRMLPPFFLIYGFIILFYRVNIIQVSWLVSEWDLGLFSAAYKLYFIALILPESFGHALFPRLASRADKGSIRDITLRSVRYTILGLTPLVLIFFIFGETLTVIVFGEAYRSSSPALVILAWALLPYVANSILGFALLADSHQWSCAKIAALALITHVMLNYVLVKIQGFQGAALSTLISLVICVLLNILYLNRLMFRVRVFFDFLYYCLPALAGGLISLVMPWGGNWGRLVMAFLVAVVVSIAIKVAGPQDLRWVLDRLSLRVSRAGISGTKQQFE